MKNYEKVIELRNLYFKMNRTTKNGNDFSFVEKMMSFKQGLKEVLYSNFKDDIIFDGDNSINYISGEYRGISFSINTYDGIRLTIDDLDGEYEILTVFNPIICIIAGYPICKYKVSSIDTEDSDYIMYEWSLNPVNRLSAIKGERFNPCGRVENLEDYYTLDLIKSLGDELLTLDGFIAIFSGINDDVMSVNDVVRIIDEVHPEIGYSNIIKWIKDSKRQFSKRLNDGK